MTFQPLHQKNVLVLNRHWLPVSVVTPADAFCHMVAGTADGLRICPDSMLTLAWNDWRKLLKRDCGKPAGRIGHRAAERQAGTAGLSVAADCIRHAV